MALQPQTMRMIQSYICVCVHEINSHYARQTVEWHWPRSTLVCATTSLTASATWKVLHSYLPFIGVKFSLFDRSCGHFLLPSECDSFVFASHVHLYTKCIFDLLFKCHYHLFPIHTADLANVNANVLMRQRTLNDHLCASIHFYLSVRHGTFTAALEFV